jgi:glutathione S-transferase
MTRPLLYTYRRCPYAMRARMALLLAGVAFDAHEITLRDKPAALLAASPKGTVPVLVLPNGTVLEESLHIMRWAFEGRDAAGWWSRAQTPSNQTLTALNDGPFKQQLDRYKYPEKFESEERNLQRDLAVNGLLQTLEQRLSTQPYLGGAPPCATDLVIFPFVRQFRAVDADWFDAQALPATQQWLQGWLQSELFAVCMRKLPILILQQATHFTSMQYLAQTAPPSRLPSWEPKS